MGQMTATASDSPKWHLFFSRLLPKLQPETWRLAPDVDDDAPLQWELASREVSGESDSFEGRNPAEPRIGELNPEPEPRRPHSYTPLNIFKPFQYHIPSDRTTHAMNCTFMRHHHIRERKKLLEKKKIQ